MKLEKRQYDWDSLNNTNYAVKIAKKTKIVVRRV